MNVIDQVLQQLNPGNYKTPILGPIRQFNTQTFGTPSYMNPNVSEDQKIMDLVMALGVKGGGGAASKFGRELRDAIPQWASSSMLNRIPSKVKGFYQAPENVNKLVSQRPPINADVSTKNMNLQQSIENVRKLIRK